MLCETWSLQAAKLLWAAESHRSRPPQGSQCRTALACICGLADRSCLIMRTVSSANASCCRQEWCRSIVGAEGRAAPSVGSWLQPGRRSESLQACPSLRAVQVRPLALHVRHSWAHLKQRAQLAVVLHTMSLTLSISSASSKTRMRMLRTSSTRFCGQRGADGRHGRWATRQVRWQVQTGSLAATCHAQLFEANCWLSRRAGPLPLVLACIQSRSLPCVPMMTWGGRQGRGLVCFNRYMLHPQACVSTHA